VFKKNNDLIDKQSIFEQSINKQSFFEQNIDTQPVFEQNFERFNFQILIVRAHNRAQTRQMMAGWWAVEAG
jgi:hypothetical protein